VTQADTTIIIDDDGTIRHLVGAFDDDALGVITGHYRNSWVGGWGDLPLQAQQWLAASFTYDPLPWWADMSPVDGPVLGPFTTRDDALKAETEWLLERDLPLPARN